MTPDTSQERLWTPWRMRYIVGQAREEGCIFCNRLQGADDVSSLILHRARHCFAIMNLFPYNTGHIMIVPNKHADDLDQLSAETLHEMADLLPITTRSLKRVLNCQGFNVGLNIGSVAGAGIAEHLHQHVVPRWLGDANFMPIIASTTVMPELVPSTYAKVRSELQRGILGDTSVRLVILANDDTHIVLVDGMLPTAVAALDQPVWRAAFLKISHWTTEIEVAGWAGSNLSDASSSAEDGIGLVLRARIADPGLLPPDTAIVEGDDQLLERVSAEDRGTLLRGFDQLAPRLLSADETDNIRS